MPFPTTPLLRDFNEADTNPDTQFTINPNASYVTTGVKVLTGTLQPISADAWFYYNVRSFPADCEAWVRHVNDAAGDLELHIRCSPIANAAFTSYYLNLEAVDTFSLNRRDAGVTVKLGADIPVTHANGDYVGIQAIGSTIGLWHKSGTTGPWVLVDTRTDATYNQTGHVSFYVSAATQLDDFGAGAYIPDSNHAATAMFARRRRRIV